MDSDDWARQGASEVIAGVHRIPLPLPQDGLVAVNVYAIDTGEGVVLIDAGMPLQVSRDWLERGLNSIGSGLGDVLVFLVTHAHQDHYTQAIAIRRELGTPVYIGAGERPSMEMVHNPGQTTLDTQVAALTRAGASEIAARARNKGLAGRPVDATNWEYPDRWLVHGERMQFAGPALRVIHTPGHTAGHMVFVDDDAGLLFAGDHVLPHITPSLGLEPAPGPLPLKDYLESLERVRAMPDMMLLPAHGQVRKDTHARVDELLLHHETRLARCVESVNLGSRTAHRVAQDLPWTGSGRRFRDLDTFNQLLAVTETAAHLDLLVDRTTLAVIDEIPARYFSPS